MRGFSFLEADILKKIGLIAMLSLALIAIAHAGLISIAGGRGAAVGISAAANWANMTSGASQAVDFDVSTEVTGRLWESSGWMDDGIIHVTDEGFHGAGAAEHRYIAGTGAAANPGAVVVFLNSSWGDENQNDGTGTDVGIDAPAAFEVAYALKMEAHLRSDDRGDGYGRKYSIVSHDGESNQAFEIVWQDTRADGVVGGYYQNPANGTENWEEAAATACSGTDFRFQPLIDRGANALTDLAAVNPDDMGAWTDCEKDQGRYGSLYTYRQAGYPDAAVDTRIWKFWEQLDPTNTLIGPILWPSNDWFWLKIRLELAAYGAHADNTIYWYIQRRVDEDWILVHQDNAADLPQDSESFGLVRYNALHLTVRRDATDEDGSIWFDDVIARIDGGVIPASQYWPSP